MEKLKSVGIQLIYGASETTMKIFQGLDQFSFLQNDPVQLYIMISKIIDNLNCYQFIWKALQIKLKEDILKMDSEEKTYLYQSLKRGDVDVLLFNFVVDRGIYIYISTKNTSRFNLQGADQGWIQFEIIEWFGGGA